MIKISHRGNVDGPNPSMENSPEYLLMAIQQGFDVEVDIWKIPNGIYTGHDAPEYKIDLEYIYKVMDKAWFHCKNLDALYFFTKNFDTQNTKFFWHQDDDYTLTSNGYIWTYPGKQATDRSVVVVLDKNDLPKYMSSSAYGICSDYM